MAEVFMSGIGAAFGAVNLALIIYLLRRIETRIDRLEDKLDRHIERDHLPAVT